MCTRDYSDFSLILSNIIYGVEVADEELSSKQGESTPQTHLDKGKHDKLQIIEIIELMMLQDSNEHQRYHHIERENLYEESDTMEMNIYCIKIFIFRYPMQMPTSSECFSRLKMHFLQISQWNERGCWIISHSSQKEYSW